MIRPLTCATLLAAALLPPAPAQAAESFDNCSGYITSLPATITTQGVWCLDRDLATNLASGSAIIVATNNVIIDCNDFKIGNLAAGAANTANGVTSVNRLNTTIRNCNIRGFFSGIFMNLGGGHLVEGNRLDGNLEHGILVAAAGSTVRDNLVVDTGGATTGSGFAAGIRAQDGVDVINNTINVVAPGYGNADAVGIWSNFNNDASINGNRIRGVVPSGSGLVSGIYGGNSARTIVRDNNVHGPGVAVVGGLGIRCSSSTSTAHNNVVVGFETGIFACVSTSNSVNPN